MQEVAQATFMFEHFPEVMGMLWKRMLHENKKNWRRTYKVSDDNIYGNIKTYMQKKNYLKLIMYKNSFHLYITILNIFI